MNILIFELYLEINKKDDDIINIDIYTPGGRTEEVYYFWTKFLSLLKTFAKTRIVI